MKVNNLLKKVGSVVTTAALLASLGTTAFADVVGNVGTGVNITGISKADKGNGVYEVTVNYESAKANEVGVTMLMYGSSINDNLSLDTSADNNKYGEGMKIVAVDQDNAAEITDNKGAFTFKVTTDSNAAGGYYLAKGKTALIAVNGDSATGHPAYASFAIPYVANYAAAIDDIEATVEANATEEQIKEALNTAAKDETASLSETADGDEVATAALTNATISAWTLGTDGKYTATATLAKADLAAGDNAVEMADNVTVALTATLTKTAVDADKISAIEGASAPTGDETAFTMTVDKDSFTAAQLLVGKKVTVAKDNVTAQITLTSDMITVPDYTASDNDQTITYTVKVGAGTSTGNKLLNVTTELTADVKVTVTSKAVVNKIELVGSAISVEVTKGDNDDATKAAIKTALDNAIKSGYEFKVTDTKGSEVDVDLDKATYEWTVTGSDMTFTATLTVSALPDTVTAEFKGATVVTITTAPVITVNEKPAYTLGDVVVDGNINSLDAVAVMKYATGIDKNLTAEQLLAANVTKGDSVINSLDAVEIMKKATGIIKKFPIEE